MPIDFSFLNVTKAGKWHVVVDAFSGEELIGYRQKKDAESFAIGHINFMYGDAEAYNDRRDAARAYLAERAVRVCVPSAQMSLF